MTYVKTEWELMWGSTAHERYDTDMNERARKIVEASGLEITDDFGGSMLGVEDGPNVAENGFDVVGTRDEALMLQAALEEELGKMVSLTEFDDRDES